MRQLSRMCGALMLAVGATGAPAQVSIAVQIPGVVQMAPPVPRAERVPVMAPDRVWVPGHWQWRDGRYVWRNGHAVAARPDYAYTAGRWVPANGGWRWDDGRWEQVGAQHRHEQPQHGHCPPGQAKKGRC